MNLGSTDIKQVRSFGIIAVIFFGCFSSLGFWMQKQAPAYLFGFLALLGAAFFIFPSQLQPVHAVWLKVANILGRIITAVALTLAYYLVITPSALLKRIFGGTPLPGMPDKKASTYWVNRREPSQAKERFIKRY